MYHINDEGKVGVCKATKRPCRFGNNNAHYSSRAEALDAQQKKNTMPRKQQRNLKPIVVTPQKMNGPETWNVYNTKITTENTVSGKIINLKKTIEDITRCKEKNWPSSFQSTIDEYQERWQKISNWKTINGNKTPPKHLISTLTDSYYSEPNANDSLGILEHVREKGFETNGLTPIESVKKLLRHENAKYLRFVETSTQLDCREVDFSQIHEAKRHYERIEASEPKVLSKNSREIIGIAYEQPNGEMKLLDGHHRYKFKKERGETSGRLIVLSH